MRQSYMTAERECLCSLSVVRDRVTELREEWPLHWEEVVNILTKSNAKIMEEVIQ